MKTSSILPSSSVFPLRPALAVLAAVGALVVLLPGRLEAQASANAGWPNGQGCWCGYMSAIPRNWTIRGKSSSASMKQAASDAIQQWNRYSGPISNVTIDSSSSLGVPGNGINEVNVFISQVEAKSIYGFALDSGTFGASIARPGANFSGTFNGCKDWAATGCGPFTEADVVINADFGGGWTDDWFGFNDQASNDPGVIYSTATHEVGHSLGLHHVYDLPAPATTSFSIMNYGNHDARRWVTRMDANTIRAEYPAYAKSLTDVGIFAFTYGNGQAKYSYSTLGASSVLPGVQFSLNKWILENIGTTTASNVVVRFYAWPAGSRKYPEPTDVLLGSVSFASIAVNTHAEYSGTPLTVPTGTTPGGYNVGAIVTVNGSEDSDWVAGLPNNNRFTVGHKPFLTLTVLTPPPPAGVTADFSYAPTAPKAGDSVAFTDRSQGGATRWSWSFGDPGSGSANTSTLQSPRHAFSGPGSFTVTLSASGSSNTSTFSRVVTVTGSAPGVSVTRVVPIVLDLPGPPHYSSELTLTNRGTSTATLSLKYTAAPILGASGSGTVSETLLPGQQLVKTDAIAYLRGKGLAIPTSGGQGGSLRVTFSNLSSEGAAFAGARTTAPSGNGRAGLAYPGTDVRKAYAEDIFVFGLRQSQTAGVGDRSNLAVVNAGTSGPITLRIEVYPASGADGVSLSPDTVLQPGEWLQYGNVLNAGGWAEGNVIVKRVAGSEPFLAYGVFNDNKTNDGSFVEPVRMSGIDTAMGVPVLVESNTFQSELTVASMSDKASSVFLNYTESVSDPKGDTGWFYVDLAPYEQVILPDIINALREAGAPISPRGGGAVHAGYLLVAFADDVGLVPGVAGARTAAPAPTGGQYGLFYPGSLFSQTARDAWVFGLVANSSSRSNLAVANAGVQGDDIAVRLQVFDGSNGALVSEKILPTLKPGDWYQEGNVLGSTAQGYCRLTVVGGNDSFLAYGVVNDGKDSSSGTNDGSFVAMEPVK